MIICRTPYRMSFFGGGTDYPTWVAQHGGAVLATSIDKYCYVTARRLPPFFEHDTRIVYSKMELVQRVEEIQHPVVREVMRFLDLPSGLEIHHDGDLPARSGVGSSSAFTVGLLHCLYSLRGELVSKRRLAEEAVMIEQERVGDRVGCQDQFLAALGGFNRLDFDRSGHVQVTPITLPRPRVRELEDHLLLFYTGLSRFSSEIAQHVVHSFEAKAKNLHRIREMVDEGQAVLQGAGDLRPFGELLHEGWQLKRGLSEKVSNDSIDRSYATALEAGAIGGKLLGAGGGGFLLVFARPEDHPQIVEAMDLLQIPFEFDTSGSQIIFYDPDSTGQWTSPRRTPPNDEPPKD